MNSDSLNQFIMQKWATVFPLDADYTLAICQDPRECFVCLACGRSEIYHPVDDQEMRTIFLSNQVVKFCRDCHGHRWMIARSTIIGATYQQNKASLVHNNNQVISILEELLERHVVAPYYDELIEASELEHDEEFIWLTEKETKKLLWMLFTTDKGWLIKAFNEDREAGEWEEL